MFKTYAMKLTMGKALAAIVLLFLAIMLFSSGKLFLIEGKNILNPYIDTQFAAKYTPDKFDKITIGMKESEVLSILGQPMYKGDGYKDSLNVNYQYTTDGKLLNTKYDYKNNTYDDFAWYQSALELDKKGKVVAIYKCWCHD